MGGWQRTSPDPMDQRRLTSASSVLIPLFLQPSTDVAGQEPLGPMPEVETRDSQPQHLPRFYLEPRRHLLQRQDFRTRIAGFDR